MFAAGSASLQPVVLTLVHAAMNDRSEGRDGHHQVAIADTSGAGWDSAALAAGTAVNGLLAYAFFALVTRGLGADSAAPVAVLWTYWGACTAFITFPLQHWVIRTLRAEGEAAVGAGLRRLLTPVVLFAGTVTLLTWLAAEELFTTTGPVFPLLAGVVTLGTFLTGVVRGALAGRDRFTATAVALAADNLVRVIGALVVLRGGGGAQAVGIVLAVGAAIGLAWPSALRYPTDPAGPAQQPERMVGTVAAGSALAQLVLVGGPIAVSLLDGTPGDVTTIFVTMALFRAPFLMALGLANRVTGPLTDWTLRGAIRLLRRFHMLITAVTLSCSVAGALVGMVAGPRLVALVFGSEVRPDSDVSALIAAGSVMAVGTLALSLAAIGQGRGLRIMQAWLVASIGAVIVLVVTPASPLLTVGTAFLAGETIAFASLLWANWRAIPTVAVRDGDPLYRAGP